VVVVVVVVRASPQAMGCLVQMASVRRTLFLTEDERQTYLANLMQMIIDVLKNKTGNSFASILTALCMKR
jgi:hypothetical protein